MTELPQPLLTDSAATVRGVEPVAYDLAMHAARAVSRAAALDVVRDTPNGAAVVVRNHADGADYLIGFTVRRLPRVTSTCCDGTGYASHASAPCPAPDCPVPVR